MLITTFARPHKARSGPRALRSTVAAPSSTTVERLGHFRADGRRASRVAGSCCLPSRFKGLAPRNIALGTPASVGRTCCSSGRQMGCRPDRSSLCATPTNLLLDVPHNVVHDVALDWKPLASAEEPGHRIQRCGRNHDGLKPMRRRPAAQRVIQGTVRRCRPPLAADCTDLPG